MNRFWSFEFQEYTPVTSSRYVITPEDNLLVLFPSNLYHHVEPNQSNEDRISLSFNVKVREKND